MAEKGILEDWKETLLVLKEVEQFSYRQIQDYLETQGIYVNKRSIERAFARWKDQPMEVKRVAEDKILGTAENYLSGIEESTPNQAREREVFALNAELRRAKGIIRQFNERARLEDRITDELRRAVAANPYSPMLERPAIKLWTPGEKTAAKDVESEHEMLLLVSDAHYPEVVNPEEALGIEFGPEIVQRRMQYIVDRTIRLKGLHENSYPIRKLTIGVLGDMLSGNIHEELEITNAMPMGEALTNMAYMLHDMGSILATQFAEVEMIIMPGNHPRMTKKPRNKQKWDNFEYIMGQFVKGLSQDDYRVVVPKDIVYTHAIFDQLIGFTHGDGSKAASFAGIPFYGLKQRANANQAMRSVLGLDRLNMLCMGHFHQHLTYTDGDCHIVLNGAIKGGDEYSIVTRNSATDPVQALLTFHKTHGWINTERIPLGKVV